MGDSGCTILGNFSRNTVFFPLSEGDEGEWIAALDLHEKGLLATDAILSM
jgi:hypothetical protein